MAERLTEAVIRALALPASGRVVVADDREKYLRLFLTPTGATWYYCRRVQGRVRQVRLGAWPELPVVMARRRAAELSGEVAASGKLGEGVARGLTVEQAWQRYLAGHLRPHTKGWAEREALYRLHAGPAWGARRVDGLTVAEVRGWHCRLGESAGPSAANRSLELLRAVLNWCGREVGQDWGAVCRGVRRYREQSRRRFLSPEEIRRFWSALAEEPNRTWRDLWAVMLLTGQRRANVQAMRWDELDLQGGVWTIPAAKAKAGEPIAVALVKLTDTKITSFNLKASFSGNLRLHKVPSCLD